MSEHDQEYEQQGGEFDVAIIGMAGRFPGADDLETFWRNLRDGRESIRHFTDDELRAAGVPDELLADPRLREGRAAGSTTSSSSTPASSATRPREARGAGPAAAPLPGVRLGGAGGRRLRPRARAGPRRRLRRRAAPDVHRAPRLRRRRADGRVGDHWHVRPGQRQGLPRHPRLLQAGPARPEPSPCRPPARPRSSPSTWPAEPAERRVRHGAGRRRRRPRPAASAATCYQEGGIVSPDGHCRAFDAGAPAARSAGSGVGRRRAQAAGRRAGRRRHHPRRDPRLGDQQRRRAQGRLHRAERRRPGRGDRRGAGGRPASTPTPSATSRRTAPAPRSATRSRSPRSTQAFAPAADRTRLLRHRLGQDQHRPPGRGGRRGRADQDRAGAGAPADPAEPALRARRTRRSTSRRARSTSTPSCADWAADGDAAAGRRQLVRHRRHQRPRRARRGAAAPTPLRPGAAAGSCCCSRRATPAALEQATANLRRCAGGAPGREPGRRGLHAAGRPPRLPRTAASWSAATRRTPSRRSRTRIRTRVRTPSTRTDAPAVAFLFPGQGAQYAGHGAARLYDERAGLPRELDRCAELLRPAPGPRPARRRLSRGGRARRRRAAAQTALAQPALFAVEYALAQLWMAWGVGPQAMIGHSVGEYVAACLAGVFSLEDALRAGGRARRG